MKSICINCHIKLKERHQKRFCSNKCQHEFQYVKYIEAWKKGLVDGNRGVVAQNISGYLKKYLLLKFKNECAQCKWSKKHPITLKVPLEIDHIDGNARNNEEDNLRLLCPNCHSLTANFRNINKGNGRVWRRNKYLKNKEASV